MKLILSLLFLSIGQFVFGQKTVEEPKLEYGTYQIVVHDTKKQYNFLIEYLHKYESYREEDKEVVVPINDYAYIVLPSRKEIESAEFKKLEHIIYQ